MKEYEVIETLRESMVWCGLFAHDHARSKAERLHWQDMRNEIAAVIKKMAAYEMKVTR
jgi:hypothetical protein